jgi:hypothetical protein
MPNSLRHSEGGSAIQLSVVRAMRHTAGSQHFFFALLVQPPISPRNLVSNQDRVHEGASAAIKRSKTRAGSTAGS